MRLISDKPYGIKGEFVCMGIVNDSGKDYIAMLDLETERLYVEELHWGKGKNVYTSTFHFIDDEKEWNRVYTWISKNTTIFSPKKLNEILKRKHSYLYGAKYRNENPDFQIRKKEKRL